MKAFREYLPESFLAELTDGPGDSNSPINGGEADSKPAPAESEYGTRELKVGDPIIVKATQRHGVVNDLTDDEGTVVVDFGKDGKKNFNMSELEYDDYANDNNEDESYRHELNNFKKLAGY